MSARCEMYILAASAPKLFETTVQFSLAPGNRRDSRLDIAVDEILPTTISIVSQLEAPLPPYPEASVDGISFPKTINAFRFSIFKEPIDGVKQILGISVSVWKIPELVGTILTGAFSSRRGFIDGLMGMGALP